MSRKAFSISISLLAVIIGVLIFLNIRQQETQKPEYDRVYPMVNQGIRWEGAGYNGT